MRVRMDQAYPSQNILLFFIKFQPHSYIFIKQSIRKLTTDTLQKLATILDPYISTCL